MTLPVIGVTTNRGKNEHGYPAVVLLNAYVEALVEAGGVPVLIPPDLNDDAWHSLYTRLDAIMFTGGGDIALGRSGGKPHPKIGGVDPKRDELEFGLLRAASQDGKPFLGICRGIQMVNACMGGKLFTHIEDQMPGALQHDCHQGHPRDFLAHQVEVEKGSRLEQILGVTSLEVNSLHHQGINQIAPALEAVANAPDGLVEAVELIGHPFGLAVQWHPEWLTFQEPTRRLFKAFVNAARDRK